MSSAEDRQNSVTTGSLQLPGLVSQLSPVDQLSFPDTAAQPFGTPQSTNQLPAPVVTRPLFNPKTPPAITPPGITRNLPELHTGALPPVRNTTTALRQPVVIPKTGKKSTGTMRPPQGRRWVVHLAATVLLVFIAVGTLMAVVPAGTNGEAGFNPFRPILNMAQGSNSNPNFLLAQQAATVTAVTRDGYESGNTNQTYSGLPTAPPSISGNGGYDGFTYGQCTFWADYRYHQLTGYWVPWGGDAYAWAYGAQASGWIVSGSPHVPSIIVLQAGVQGAGPFGHVGVVERINSDGSVYVSNWNWYNNGGGWGTLSYWTFHPGPGVSFVWHG